MSNRIIYSYPRSATKLLASVHETAGYYSFGEFFNTKSCKIITQNGLSKAVRLEPDQIIFSKTTQLAEWNKIRELNNRYDLYKYSCEHLIGTPHIITFFHWELVLQPKLFDIFQNKQILCLRRKNWLETILSHIITRHNKNFNEEHLSNSVVVTLPELVNLYMILLRTNDMQQYLIKNYNATVIDFDDLISGKSDLEFCYTVNSNDQHDDIESYIINIDEVKWWWNLLEKEYSNA